ncbi:DUF3038 domain-containing protein [Tumidithrix elongata RA019]|uniref:DUF3038 domain-containing protein n=2 Tax=Tumidithrix TaxID=3088355 RepID=A0AAW9Q1F3_9CYAN|nr:DUF3038 domain-containing protein [Tumidithrix elongata RA019]
MGNLPVAYVYLTGYNLRVLTLLLTMQLNISQTAQAEIDLPVPHHFARGCPRSVRMDIDNLMLAIEAIDLQAIEAMLALVPQLKLEAVIPNRVSFWRLRNANPLRRNYQRSNLGWEELRALVKLVCTMSQQFNTILRLLVTTHQQVAENKIEALGLQQSQFYLDLYVERFSSLYLSRMRSPSPLSKADIKELGLQLLTQLLFASGTAGELRLWHSLFDGATA